MKPTPAASTAAVLNPVVASTDGPLAAFGRAATPVRDAPEAVAAGEAEAEAEAEAEDEADDEDEEAAGGGAGPASVPAGATLLSAEKPQSSSFSAAVISVSAGQCSRVTMSVTPCRVAIPT